MATADACSGLCAAGSFSTAVGAADGGSCNTCVAGSYATGGGASACSLCAAGSFSTAVGAVTGGTCVLCTRGSYMSANGSAGPCVVCPAGSLTTNAMSGSTSVADCLPCASGTYSTVGDSGMCPACPRGSYNTGTGMSSIASCTLCAAGTYGQSWGVSRYDSPSTCLQCSAGTYSSASGAFDGSACAGCSAGSYSSAVGASYANTCASCDIGTYAPTAGASVCPTCAAATATGMSTCFTCVAGTFAAAGATACSNCSAGAYSTGVNMESCSLCWAGSYSAVIGGSTCQSCTAGSYGTGNGMSLCSVCQAGSFSTASGAPTAATCSLCQAGSFSTASGAPTSVTCSLCQAGSFSTASGAPTAASCSRCQAGAYSTASGAITAATCSLCQAGSFSTASGAPTAATCSLCQAGSFSTASGAPTAATCSLCQAGSFSTASGAPIAATCSLCQAGSFSTASGALTAATCSLCQRGAYSTASGAPTAATCSLCQAGSFSTASGAPTSATCSLCQAGAYSTASGAPTAANCSLCQAGSFSTALGAPTAATCSLCQAGAYSTASGALTAATCALCQVGSYASTQAATACQTCSAGTYSTGTGMPTSGSCAGCAMGAYSSFSGASTCVLCAAGTYSNNSTGSGITWTQCAAESQTCTCTGYVRIGANGIYGTPQSVTGSISCSYLILGDPTPGVSKTCQCGVVACTSCGAGTYATGAGMSACASCTTCSSNARTYSSCTSLGQSWDSTVCVCNAGYGGNGTSSAGCQICSAGTSGQENASTTVNLTSTCRNGTCSTWMGAVYGGNIATNGAWRTLDGSLSTGCHSACSGAGQYWAIDFEQAVNVTGIKFWDRQECCWSREDGLRVYVGDELQTGATYNTTGTNNALCYTDPGGSAYVQRLVGAVMACTARGRYLYIVGQADCLHFSEVQVWGSKPSSGANYVPTVCTACGSGTYSTATGQSACKGCPASAWSTAGASICTSNAGYYDLGKSQSFYYGFDPSNPLSDTTGITGSLSNVGSVDVTKGYANVTQVSSQYLTFPAVAVSSSFSICWWHRPVYTGANTAFLTIFFGTPYITFTRWHTYDSMLVNFWNFPGGTQQIGVSQYPCWTDNAWQHVCAAMNTTHLSMYYNGSKRTLSNSGALTVTVGPYVKSANTWNALFWSTYQGLADDVRFFNSTLTATEVGALFNQGFGDSTTALMAPCDAGTYSNASSLTSSAGCQACAAGSYTSTAAQTTCQPCGAGTYLTATGQTVCVGCPSNSWSTAGATVCTANAGYYDLGKAQTFYYAFPTASPLTDAMGLAGSMTNYGSVDMSYGYANISQWNGTSNTPFQYLKMPAVSVYSNFTICVWHRPYLSDIGYRRAFSISASASSQNMIFYQKNLEQTAHLSLASSTGAFLESSDVIPYSCWTFDKWQQVCLGITPTTVQMYCNGTLRALSSTIAGQDPNALSAPFAPLIQAAVTQIGQPGYKGLVDDVRLFNATLSSTEIGALFNKGFGDATAMLMTQCAAGTYLGTSGSTSSASCVACATGSYTSAAAQTTCQPCGAGTYAAATGLSACVGCPTNSWSTAGATVCTANAGYYDLGKAQTFYYGFSTAAPLSDASGRTGSLTNYGSVDVASGYANISQWNGTTQGAWSQYLSMPPVDVYSSFTACWWHQPFLSDVGFQGVFRLGMSTASLIRFFQLSTGQSGRTGIYKSNAYIQWANVAPDACWTFGAWQHVCIAVNTTKVQVYCNKTVRTMTSNIAGQTAYDLPSPYGPMIQGTGNYLGEYGYKGLVDDVRLFNTTLTSTEISALFDKGFGDSTAMLLMPCAAGTYLNTSGSTSSASCVACAAGSYTSTAGQTTCQPCGAGTYVTVTGVTTCVGCPANSWSTAGAIACTANAGYYDLGKAQTFYYGFDSGNPLRDSTGVTGSLVNANGIDVSLGYANVTQANATGWPLTQTMTFPAFDIYSSFSVCWWLRPTNPGRTVRFFYSDGWVDMYNIANTFGFHTTKNGGTTDTLYGYVSPDGCWALNVWQHTCVAFNATNVTVYCNGTARSLLSSTGTLSPGAMLSPFGPYSKSANYLNNIFVGGYKGLYDDQRLFNATLTSTEASTLFAAGFGDSTAMLMMPCPAGSYSTSVGSSAASTCMTCGAGTFSSAAGSTTCTSCATGTYSAISGSSTCSTCSTCASGASSLLTCGQFGMLGLSRDVTTCGCNAGYTGSASACQACAAGSSSSLAMVELTKTCGTGSTTCTAWASSYYVGNEPSKALDGVLAYPNVVYTQTGQYQFWAIDFETIVTVTSFNFWDRQECCQYRENGFRVYVGNVWQANGSAYNLSNDNTLCYQDPSTQASMDLRKSSAGANLACAASGRYLYVVNNVVDALNIAEIRIFGYRGSTPACATCSAGSYSGASASTTCSSCAVGNYSSAAGASSCLVCGVGLTSTATRATACTVMAGYYDLNVSHQAYFPFSTLNDVSGVSPSAVSTGSPVMTAQGRVGGAINFTQVGGTQYLTIPNMTITQNYTICMWYYAQTTQTFASLLRTSANAGTYIPGFSFYYNGAFAFKFSSAAWATSVYFTFQGVTWPSQKWTHVCFALDGLSASLYLNGTLNSKTTSLALVDSYSDSMQIGFGLYVGMLDELRVFNRALSAAEIAAVYSFSGDESSAQIVVQCPAGTYSSAGTSSATCTPCPASSTSPAGASVCVANAGYYNFDPDAQTAYYPFNPSALTADKSGRLGALTNYGNVTTAAGGWTGQYSANFSQPGGLTTTNPKIQYLALPAPLSLGTQLTICAWHLASVATGYGRIWDFANGQEIDSVVLARYNMHASSGTIQINNGGTRILAQNVANLMPTSGIWTHNCMAINGASLVHYLNGAQVYSATMSGSFIARTVVNAWIARPEWSGNEMFVGLIDEFRLFNRSLSAVEANAVYAERGDGSSPQLFAACPAGTFSTGIGATASSVCVACVAGTYSSVGATACRECPVGSYSTAIGATAAAACAQCAAGTAAARTILINTTVQYVTLPGYYQASIVLELLQLYPWWMVPYNDFFEVASSTAQVKVWIPSNRMCPYRTQTFAFNTRQTMVLQNLPNEVMNFYLNGTLTNVCAGDPGGSLTYQNWPLVITAYPGYTNVYYADFTFLSGLSSCTTCPAGTYTSAPGVTSCQSCAAGAYSSGLGLTVCSTCAAGSYSSALGATTSSVCQKCTVGLYSTALGAINSSTCLACGTGKYSTGTGMSTSGACSVCAAGTYSNLLGASGCTACTVCSVNATRYSPCLSPGLTQDSTVCVCNAGYSGNGTSCQMCSAGTMSVGTAASVKLTSTCSNGNCIAWMSTVYSGNVALYGPALALDGIVSILSSGFPHTQTPSAPMQYWAVDFQQSVLVAAVSFWDRQDCCQTREDGMQIYVGDELQNGTSFVSNGTTNTLCYTDPGGTAYVQRITGAFFACVARGRYLYVVSITGVLNFAEIQVWGTRPKNNSVTSSCADCSTGTYSSSTGSSACASCSAGTYSSAAAATASATCQQCAVGSYSSAIGATISSTCTVCSEGKYSTYSGATADCTLGIGSCPGNSQLRSVTSAGILPVLPPTYMFKATVMRLNLTSASYSLVAGVYNHSLGVSDWGWRPAYLQTRTLTDMRIAVNVAAILRTGYTVRLNVWETFEVLSHSSYGTIKLNGVTLENVAVTGSRSATYNSIFYTDGSALALASNVSVTFCQCNPGYFGDADTANCTICSAGTYASAAGASTCSSCVAGSYSTVLGASSSATCALCVAGSYSTAVGAANSATCALCTAGSYSTALGATACAQCPTNTYTLGTGTVSLLSCLCRPGYTCAYSKKVRVVISVPNATLQTFNSSAFVEMVAKAAKVPVSRVTIVTVWTNTGARRLLGQQVQRVEVHIEEVERSDLPAHWDVEDLHTVDARPAYPRRIQL